MGAGQSDQGVTQSDLRNLENKLDNKIDQKLNKLIDKVEGLTQSIQKTAIASGAYDVRLNAENNSGLCVIVTNAAPSDTDVESLRTVFENIKFKVDVVANNPPFRLDAAMERANNLSTDYCTLVVAVIWRDATVRLRHPKPELRAMWEPFVAGKNEWNEKPKVFLLQIDRRHSELVQQYPGGGFKDILIAHSVPDSHGAGGFIEVLTRALKMYPRNEITELLKSLESERLLGYCSTLQKPLYF